MTQYIKLALTGSVHKIAERKGAWVRAFMGDGSIKAFRGTQFTYVDAPDTAVTAEEAFGAANSKRPVQVPTNAASAPKKARETAPRARKPLNERKNGVVDTPYLQFYKAYRQPNGVLSVDNGDDVATKLRAMDLARVYAYAAGLLNESVDGLKARYEHLNPGMQRMNLGNRIRAFLKDQ